MGTTCTLESMRISDISFQKAYIRPCTRPAASYPAGKIIPANPPGWEDHTRPPARLATLYPTARPTGKIIRARPPEILFLAGGYPIGNSIGNGKHAGQILLDLLAAFDTGDHEVLLRRQSNSFGVVGNSLEWLRSYLSNRTQSVKIH